MGSSAAAAGDAEAAADDAEAAAEEAAADDADAAAEEADAEPLAEAEDEAGLDEQPTKAAIEMAAAATRAAQKRRDANADILFPFVD